MSMNPAWAGAAIVRTAPMINSFFMPCTSAMCQVRVEFLGYARNLHGLVQPIDDPPGVDAVGDFYVAVVLQLLPHKCAVLHTLEHDVSCHFREERVVRVRYYVHVEELLHRRLEGFVVLLPSQLDVAPSIPRPVFLTLKVPQPTPLLDGLHSVIRLPLHGRQHIRQPS